MTRLYLGINGYQQYDPIDGATMIIVLIGMLIVLAVIILWREK